MQQLTSLGEGGRRRDVTSVQSAVQLAGVHLDSFRERQPVATHVDGIACKPKVASQDPQRVAQTLARALVQDVGPETAGELSARLRTRVQREIREQRARRRRARSSQRCPVELQRKRTEEPDSQHGDVEPIATTTT